MKEDFVGKFNFIYYFDSVELALIESKRLDLSTSASLSDVYKWTACFKTEKRFVPLTFRSMQKSADVHYRSFNEGELKFTETSAEFKFENLLYKMDVTPVETLPMDFRLDLTNYLVSIPKHH